MAIKCYAKLQINPTTAVYCEYKAEPGQEATLPPGLCDRWEVVSREDLPFMKVSLSDAIANQDEWLDRRTVFETHGPKDPHFRSH